MMYKTKNSSFQPRDEEQRHREKDILYAAKDQFIER
ncbi:hypothetical protein SAMN05192551_1166 [Tindallia magadiensis]|uniref:Uncharacterized protein n=1 Tax=Tindallia magadiensis TaxID=69895 RepID=A0A1I3HT39_9FIRM|nr:hypothetical protein SAMN05192551_1166 [Tindallia magadiensis]